MNSQPPEVFHVIMELVDINSLTKSTLTCWKWAEYIIAEMPRRLEHILGKMQRVDVLKVFIDDSSTHYSITAEIGRESNSFQRKIGDMEIYLPDHLFINNTKTMIPQTNLYTKCVAMMPFWWTSCIKTVTMVDFPLSMFGRVSERFPNKESLSLIIMETVRYGRLIYSGVNDMKQLMTAYNEFDLHLIVGFIREARSIVIFDDSILELLISRLSLRPMGNLSLNLDANVSLPALLHFFEAVSASPLPLRLKERKITLMLKEIQGDKNTLNEFLKRTADLENHCLSYYTVMFKFRLNGTIFMFCGRLDK